MEDLIEQTDTAARPVAQADYDQLFAMLQQLRPGAERIEPYQLGWLSPKVQQANYDYDPQEARQYFEHDRVRDGIFALFGSCVIVGAALVSVWAYGLLKETGRVLLDANMDAPITEEVREVIKELNLKLEITDLHVWRVGRGKFSCVVALAAHEPVTPEFIRQQLKVHEELVHVSVEVNHLLAESGLRA